MTPQEEKEFVDYVRRAEEAYNVMMLHPERYTQQQRDEITAEKQLAVSMADAVMKEELAKLSPKEQDVLLDLLGLESGLGRKTWEDLLL